jgi:enediyne biosynthesis protein E4
LVLANGHVYPEVDKFHLSSGYMEPRLLYHNNGNGTFTDVTASAGPGFSTVSSARGLAVGDFWNDGRVSVLINNVYAKPSLLVNAAHYNNHWVTFKTEGTRSNRDGIGAKISVKAVGRTLVDEVRSGSSYISQNDLRVHFGLGGASKIDEVEVRWPSGLVEHFDNLSADAIHVLKEGTGITSPSGQKKP